MVVIEQLKRMNMHTYGYKGTKRKKKVEKKFISNLYTIISVWIKDAWRHVNNIIYKYIYTYTYDI